MKIRLLPGQVVVRELLDRGTIIVPVTSEKLIRSEARSHRGVVLAMGSPAKTPSGIEIPKGFSVGDIVYFHWIHNESKFTRPWPPDALDACWIPQEAIDAVEDP